MREAGLVVGRTLQALAAAVAPGVTTARARRPRRVRDPRRGRHPVVQGLPAAPLGAAVPRVDLRVGERRDRARHPRPAGAARRRHHLDRLRRHPGRLARRRRRHRRRWGRCPRRPASCCGSPRSRCGAASPPPGSAAGSRTSATPSRATPASQGDYGIVEEYGGHGIGTEMHQEPHVLNYGRPGRGPKLQKGLALAVEPMLTQGARYTRELDDGWTVVDGRRQPRGALRAHLRAHRARPVGADRARRRRRAAGSAGRARGVLGWPA